MEMFFGSMTMTIQDNGLYQMFMMGKSENGFWEFNSKDSSEITLNTENGEMFETSYSFISKDRIRFSLNTVVYILKRVPMDNVITLKDVKSLPEAIALDKKTIAQKWYYVESIDSTKRQEIVDAGNAMLKGAYLDLKSNGKFDQDVILLRVKGKWELAHDGKALVTKSGGMSKIWFFESFDGTNLMLFNPINSKRILYSIEKPNK